MLARLDAFVAPATVATTGGRYLGFVVGGALPVAASANWLATVWDQNAALVEMSPAAAHMDAIALRWATQALRLPSQATGGLVTGATAANTVALAAARTHLLQRAGWSVEERGLYGAPELRVVVSEDTHASVHKALMVLGLGRARVTTVPVDAHGRMDVRALPALDDRTIVCTQAGHVHTGAFDPVGEVARRARDVGAWVHVDGAFGLWARASRTLDALTDGIELADSWSADAHKWLNVPYDSGIVLTVHDDAIRRAMSAWSPLLSQERQPAAYTLEQSRRARGVDVWAALAHLGREGVAAMVERTCRHARTVADALRALGGHIPHDVVLNQILVSFGDDERTDKVWTELQRDGTLGCSAATWNGRRYVGISVSSWATDEADVERIVTAVERVLNRA